MADREKVIHDFSEWCDSMDELCPVICLDVLALLKEQPGIVLCGDCRNGHLVGSGFCICRKDGKAHYHDWYCADGEVKIDA